ncbi:MAG: penicillin acylase family protein [Bacteroidota bacterium]
MMKTLQFSLSLVLCIGLCYFLNRPLALGEVSLPPLGSFLSPFNGFWQNAEPSTGPVLPSRIQAEQLTAPVEVYFDERLVPHIFAQNQADAYFAQGYLTAQHRLWQLDISTRSVAGRLAEVVGPRALDRDRKQRRLGMVFAAENTLKRWKKDATAYQELQAYLAGINAYINQLDPADYPLEFKLLDYAPEPMTELKVALFVKAMATTLCFREADLKTTNALAHWGRETFDFLYPSRNPKQQPIVRDFQPEVEPPLPQPDPAAAIGLLYHKALPAPPPHLGSNNWAVDGSKTASGHPMLCNDPHLKLSLPSIWYEIQIVTPEYNAYGASLPGLPSIIIGFNQNIAWGETNVAQDVNDWYRIEWTDDSKSHYLLDGAPVATELRVERYEVKGLAEVYDTVRYTHWGPVVYEDPEHPQHDLAMHWLAHYEPEGNDLTAFSLLNRARGYDDYTTALSEYHSPPQNFVFASNTGDIGMWVNGQFPIRRGEQGRFVMDGSQTANGWSGFIPHAHKPHEKNPGRHFVFSANQRSTDAQYPYSYHGNFEDYRGRYLYRQLDSLQGITVEDMQALQNDNYSIQAEEALPLLLRFVDPQALNAEQKRYYELLREWDYRFEAELAAPAVFENWWTHFYDLTWDEILQLEDQMEMLRPESWRTIALLESDTSHVFFDYQGSPQVEGAREIARMAFDSTCQELVRWELDNGPLRWVNYQQLDIAHLARIAAFTRSAIPVGGYRHALNAITTSTGPSWRMIVELGDPVRAYGVYPGGQSGNPGSRHYDDMIDHWAQGRYYPLHFVQSVEEVAEKSWRKMELNNQ